MINSNQESYPHQEELKIQVDWQMLWHRGRSPTTGYKGQGSYKWPACGISRRRWRASKVKIDGPKRSCDDMEWIISFKKDQAKCWLMMMIKKLDGVWCLCGLRRWNGMHKAKVWLVGHFISPVKGCVEKCMTGFRIDGRTIKRGKLVCLSVI